MSRFVKPLQSISRLSDRVGGGGGKKPIEIVGTVQGRITGSNNVIVPFPSGHRAGDLFMFFADITTGDLAIPTGFIGSYSNVAKIYFRIFDGSEGANVDLGTNSGNQVAFVGVLLRNAVITRTLIGGNSSSLVMPTVASTTSNLVIPPAPGVDFPYSQSILSEKLFAFLSNHSSTQKPTSSPPSGMTLLTETASGTPNAQLYVEDYVSNGLNNVSTRIFPASGSSTRYGTIVPVISY